MASSGEKYQTSQPPAYGTGPAPQYSAQYGGYNYNQQPPPPGAPTTSTTVVVTQPAAGAAARGPREWSSGLCDCCSDMGICMCGTFCGLCLACQLSSDMQESMCVPCCVPGWLIALRMKMRTQEKIPGSLMDDCCVSVFCGACTLCQLARENRYVQLLNAQQANAPPTATVTNY